MRLKRNLVLFVIMAAFLMPNAAFADRTSVASSSEQGIKELEAKIVSLINTQREKNGIAPLDLCAELSNVARIKSQDMAKRDYLSHISPTYGSPFEMLEAFGVSYSMAGENVSKGERKAEAVLRKWMSSPDHRNNILNPLMTCIGAGAAQTPDGAYCWTTLFVKP